MTAEEKTLKKRLPSYVMLCFFAAFNVCFYMPMDIYIPNANDIEIPIKPFAACLGIVTLAVFAAALLICLLTKGRANRIFRAALFGVSAAFYIQGSFLAANMGVLNGERYAPPLWRSALSIVVWLAVLTAAFIILWKLPEEFDGLVSYIAGAVFIVQIIALGISAYSSIPKYDLEQLNYILEGESISYCSAKDIELYSKNKNLIVFVADEYDSFLFDNSMEEAPESLSEFDGFTYYTNTVGKYDLTEPSIAYLTSGGAYGKQYRNMTFFKNAAENFKANFYTSTTIPPASVTGQYCDNVGTVSLSLGDVMLYSKDVYRLAFFRCMPELVKPLFMVDGSDIGGELKKLLEKRVEAELDTTLYSYDDLEFYNNLPRELTTTDENVFKFIYILGVHSPRTVTKDFEQTVKEVSPEDEAIVVNKIVNEYLKILKENGVYDNSEIIFMADHGLTGHLEKKFPMLMYKPAHQTETGITISNAPISYDDMFPTLIKLTGGEPQARTIFDIAEDEERVRYFGDDDREVIVNAKLAYN